MRSKLLPLLVLAVLVFGASCASTPKMQLTDAAKQVKVLHVFNTAETQQVYDVKGRCKQVGEKKSDDLNEVLNEAGAAHADTVILEKPYPFTPDFWGTFYSCESTP